MTNPPNRPMGKDEMMTLKPDTHPIGTTFLAREMREEKSVVLFGSFGTQYKIEKEERGSILKFTIRQWSPSGKHVLLAPHIDDPDFDQWHAADMIALKEVMPSEVAKKPAKPNRFRKP